MSADLGKRRDTVDVDALFVYLNRGLPAHAALQHHRPYVRNIAYSLQYIDHLLGVLEHGDVTRTLHSQTCKSIVVVGMGVVEAILWYLLLTTGGARTRSWKSIKDIASPEFAHGGQTLRIVNMVEEKLVQPEIEEMTLDAMVKRTEKRQLLGQLDHAVYGHLKVLRQLRNRVHIHAVKHATDTDWQSFTGREVKLLLDALVSILGLPLFQPTPERRDFMKFLDSGRVERRA
ncbi:hypothetical protein ACLBYG_25300 [Methylobacterium sp. D53M]